MSQSGLKLQSYNILSQSLCIMNMKYTEKYQREKQFVKIFTDQARNDDTEEDGREEEIEEERGGESRVYDSFLGLKVLLRSVCSTPSVQKFFVS